MIGKTEMMDMLLEACPSFTPTWQAFLDEWREEPVELPVNLALADFARHLIELLERNERRSLNAAFVTIERLHVDGDDFVRNAATVGLLESLQNLNLHATTEPEQFRPYLRPVSERWWEKLYRFWEHGELLTDD